MEAVMHTTRRIVVTGLATAIFTGCARGQGAPRGYAPPPGAYAAAAQYSAKRNGVSMLVMRAGEVLFEDYPSPGGPAKGWELASATKSFSGVMAALASADGLLDIDEPCAKTLPEWAGDARNRITLRHLLSLTSGLATENPTGRPQPYAEAIKAKAESAPGQVFAYGPTPFQIFGEILNRKLVAAGRPADPVAYLQLRVLDGIGARPVEWRRGTDRNPFLPQGAHFAARDLARFGQWVMDGAKGADPKVMNAMFEGTTANPGYGLTWWLLRPGLIGPSPRAGVDASTIGAEALKQDIVMAAGAGNQRLYLIRSKKLVVVRQANRILQAARPRGDDRWMDGEFLELLPKNI
jgi:CubicO group peptidase (beta-lactamase class C family)